MSRVAVASRGALPLLQNYAIRSQDMSNVAAWILGTGVTCTANTNDVTDPLGGNTATKLVYDGTGTASGFRLAQATGLLAGPWPTTSSMWVRCPSGQSTSFIMGCNSAVSAAQAVTDVWTQLSVTAAVSIFNATCALFGNAISNAARTVYVWQAQTVAATWVGYYTPTTSAAVNTGAIRNLSTGRTTISNRSAP